jgi:hypothetical protein
MKFSSIFHARNHIYSSADGYEQTEKLNSACIQLMWGGLSIVLAKEFYELLCEILGARGSAVG